MLNLKVIGLFCQCNISLWIKRHEAKLCLHWVYVFIMILISHPVAWPNLRVYKIEQMICDDPSSNVVLLDRCRVSNTTDYRHRFGDIVTRLTDHASWSARTEKRKYGLVCNTQTLHLEILKHDLSHFLAVRLWIEWDLCEKDSLFWRVDAELRRKAIFPYLFHVIPVCDNTRFNRVFNLQNTSIF